MKQKKEVEIKGIFLAVTLLCRSAVCFISPLKKAVL